MLFFIIWLPVCQEEKAGQELRAANRSETINTAYRLALVSLLSFLS